MKHAGIATHFVKADKVSVKAVGATLMVLFCLLAPFFTGGTDDFSSLFHIKFDDWFFSR